MTKLLAPPVIADKTDLELLALSPTPDSVYADSGPGAGTMHRTPFCTERLRPLVELIEGAEDVA